MKPVKLSVAQSHASSRQAELHHCWPLVQHRQAANAMHVQQADPQGRAEPGATYLLGPTAHAGCLRHNLTSPGSGGAQAWVLAVARLGVQLLLEADFFVLALVMGH